MRILIISSTPWSMENSFGNTFSNLFQNMGNIEIYHICCKHGKTDHSPAYKTFQMTDKAVLKSIYKRKTATGWIVEPNAELQTDANVEVSAKAAKKRRTVSFIIRDMIWKLGRWKKNETFIRFLEETNPDVIYLPIYASKHMCDIQKYIVEKMGVPVVGHISDDVYGYHPKVSLLSKLYKMQLRKKLRRLIDKCSYLEVFANNMAEEYSRVFQKPCYVIGKGIKKEEMMPISYTYPTHQPWKFVYTGNLGIERYRVLCEIAKAFDNLETENKPVLEIYSATNLTDDMQKAFSTCQSLQFKGVITREEVDAVQREADFLVHVESFSPQAISATKMSFSTKIIDYLLAGKPVLGVGPSEVNSMQVLKENGLAVTATSMEEIKACILNLWNGQVDFLKMSKSVEKYLREERDIEVIQRGMKERLDKVVQR